MSLFNLGDFALHSGGRTQWKIDCDCLTDADLSALVEMIRAIVPPYGSVEGIPKGGLRLAQALSMHCLMGGPHLLIDDVLTTGGSMEAARQAYRGTEKVIGAVLFARGQCPHWIRALFQMPEALWAKPKTRGL